MRRVNLQCRGSAPRPPTEHLHDERGFTMPELIVAMLVVGLVAVAGVTAYIGTMRSWEGTAALADVQRDASFAVEVITRNTRGANEVTIDADGDSMEVVFETSTTDSVGARFYLDDQNRLVDINGTVLVTDVDSLLFSSIDGKALNIDITLKNDLDTPDRTTDDQAVLISSTVVCRN